MSLTIREARPDDWEAFCALYEGEAPDDPEAAAGRFRRKLTAELECVLVAEWHQPGATPQLVGLALAHQWDEYLMSGRRQLRFSTLRVHPDHRRRGVGRALFGGIVAWARSRDATWLEWYASPGAVPFYTRLGFTGTVCPDPDFPYYELRFGAQDAQASAVNPA